MKKFTIFIIIIILGIAGFEYYSQHKPQIQNITESLRSGAIIDNIKIEVFTPGGLRAKNEAANALLSQKGVIDATNEQRQVFGKIALRISEKLNQAALIKVKDMFKNQYFDHISPAGLGPANLAKETSYEFVSIGENLALGNYKNDLALVEAWMNSAGHRANILNSKFTEIGVAVMKGTFEGKATWLAVQEFGRPTSDCPKVDAILKQQVDDGKYEVDRLEAQVKAAKGELDSLSNSQTKEEVNFYNEKVNEYNALIKIYNNRIDTQKDAVARYNAQVKAFNECIGK